MYHEKSLWAFQSQNPLPHVLYLLSLEAAMTSSIDLHAGKEELLGFNPIFVRLAERPQAKLLHRLLPFFPCLCT